MRDRAVMPRLQGSPSNSRVTMADIAAAAEVSKITVSRALNGSSLVRPEVREKVEETAARLGYRLNLAARDLRLQQRRRIGVIVDLQARDERPLFDPYPLALLGGVLQECAAAGFAVVLATNDVRMIAEAQDTSGVIVLGQGPGHRVVRDLLRLNLPLTVWGADDGIEARLGATVVGSDNHLGGRLAARHLIEQGRRRFVYIGDTSHAEMADRETGLRAEIPGGGRSYLGSFPCQFTVDGGRAAMAEALASNPDIDAVFACSDLVAIGAMQALQAAGRSPGIDVGLVGYDDTPAAAAQSPRITSVRQDWTNGGRLLASSLLAKLEPEVFETPETLILPVSLSVRET